MTIRPVILRKQSLPRTYLKPMPANIPACLAAFGGGIADVDCPWNLSSAQLCKQLLRQARLHWSPLQLFLVRSRHSSDMLIFALLVQLCTIVSGIAVNYPEGPLQGVQVGTTPDLAHHRTSNGCITQLLTRKDFQKTYKNRSNRRLVPPGELMKLVNGIRFEPSDLHLKAIVAIAVPATRAGKVKWSVGSYSQEKKVRNVQIGFFESPYDTMPVYLWNIAVKPSTPVNTCLESSTDLLNHLIAVQAW